MTSDGEQASQVSSLTEKSLVQSKLVYGIVGFLLSIILALGTYAAVDVKKKAENAESLFAVNNIELAKLTEKVGATVNKISEVVTTMKEIQTSLNGHVEKTFELINKSGEMAKDIEHLSETVRSHEARILELEKKKGGQ